MAPISGVYQRRSISALLLAFPGKQRPPRSDHSAFTICKKGEHTIHFRITRKNKTRKLLQNQNSSSVVITALVEHVSASGRAKWWQQDNPAAAQRAPSSVHLMESVRCGATERRRMLSSAQPLSTLPASDASHFNSSHLPPLR